MELKRFIKTVLIDIVSAIKETQTEVKGNATIVPLKERSEKTTGIITEDGIADISNIDFDIAITTGTEENTEKGFKAGIKVVSVIIGGATKGDATAMSQNVSRIRFSIPVILPHSAAAMADPTQPQC